MASRTAKDVLIVALDLDNIDLAKEIVAQLKGIVDFFKFGLALQLAEGAQVFIEQLIKDGNRVFLDYKYHDIPETVRRAVERAAKLKVKFLTIHGSPKALKAAVAARNNSGTNDMKLFTVTVLTSMDEDDLEALGHRGMTATQLVLFRAQKAKEAGCDGVIASGMEVEDIKQLHRELLVIVPGIRPDGSIDDDQVRKVPPRKAIECGADYLVLGRPITNPTEYGYSNVREAATKILAEIQTALDEKAAKQD